MPSLPFGLSTFERARGDLPSLPVINMYAEAAPAEPNGVILQSRPGLSVITNHGEFPVNGIFRKNGVFGGELHFVTNRELFTDTARIGEIDGSGPFFIDGFEDKLFVAGGGNLWQRGADGAVLVPFPDDAKVTKVLVASSRAVCIRADTGLFYWSTPLTAEIDGLAFATAENQPDRLLDMLFINDALILFGAETVEFWRNTGDPDSPFLPVENEVFEVGVRCTGAACTFAETFAWVTNTGRVCVQNSQGVISNEGLEAAILASETCSLWSFRIEATDFLALRLDKRTFVFCQRGARWSEFTSWGSDNWLPISFADGVFGGSNGDLLSFSKDWIDNGGTLERRFRAGLPIQAGAQTIANLALRCNVGTTRFLEGDYKNPTVEVRASRDGGHTWGNWRSQPLGEQGRYRARVKWAALGMFGQPGVLFEWRVSDPVDFRVSDVAVNEAYGGV